jgi:hypothetical protein
MPDDKGQNELGTTFSVNVPSFSPYYLNRLLLESELVFWDRFISAFSGLLDNYVNSLCGARNMQAS